MRKNALNGIRYMGIAITFIGLGIIVGLYLSDSGFRYPYPFVAALIFMGAVIQRFAAKPSSDGSREYPKSDC